MNLSPVTSYRKYATYNINMHLALTFVLAKPFLLRDPSIRRKGYTTTMTFEDTAVVVLSVSVNLLVIRII